MAFSIENVIVGVFFALLDFWVAWAASSFFGWNFWNVLIAITVIGHNMLYARV